jgi:hypothetical protein
MQFYADKKLNLLNNNEFKNSVNERFTNSKVKRFFYNILNLGCQKFQLYKALAN